MNKTITLLTILLLVIFMVGCENSVNPIQSQTQNDNDGMSLAKGGNKGGWEIDVPAGSSIQAAIDAAVDGAIIKVGPGTYDEALLIDGKNITLIADGVVIIDPAGIGTFAIQVYNSTVNLQGFTVDATDYVLGIYAKGGSAGFEEAVKLDVTNCTVFNYGKNGITVNGSKAYGNIINNVINGNGPLGVPNYAQNGIQFGYGATGKAMRNVVTGNLYTGPDWGAAGILLFEADGILVQKNTVEECGVGVSMETWGWYEPSASYNRIIQNTINNCGYGVTVAAYSWSPYSTMDCFAENNKVTNNSITSIEGDTGVGIFLWDEVIGGFTPAVDNNKIIHNTISGFTTAIYYSDGSTKDKVHANVVD